MEKTTHKIQSFVRRSGRLTLGQKIGLIDLWPQFGIDVPIGLIDLNRLFKKIQPITLEIGFGNGDSLLEMAINVPDQNTVLRLFNCSSPTHGIKRNTTNVVL